VKTVYSKIYAPNFPSYVNLAEDLFKYLIYSSSFLPKQGLIRYFRLIYIWKESIFKQPFLYPKYRC
ncbi:hypothetical protein V2W45_1239383, partial [Cenococcum geophilum]